jgi:phosphinothricin acetyltransferase
MIRSATGRDADAIAGIYNHYIAETVVTFEEQTVTATDMIGRMDAVAAASLPWLVAEQEGEVAGYAYAGRWHSRSAYRFTVESTVYLHPQFVGCGLGTKLYEALLSELRDKPIHVVIGGIALPNAASVALHEKLGFEKAAHYREVGFKFDRWIDVGYWQKVLQ